MKLVNILYVVNLNHLSQNVSNKLCATGHLKNNKRKQYFNHPMSLGEFWNDQKFLEKINFVNNLYVES